MKTEAWWHSFELCYFFAQQKYFTEKYSSPVENSENPQIVLSVLLGGKCCFLQSSVWSAPVTQNILTVVGTLRAHWNAQKSIS